jgi:hypothetical protein
MSRWGGRRVVQCQEFICICFFVYESKTVFALMIVQRVGYIVPRLNEETGNRKLRTESLFEWNNGPTIYPHNKARARPIKRRSAFCGAHTYSVACICAVGKSALGANKIIIKTFIIASAVIITREYNKAYANALRQRLCLSSRAPYCWKAPLESLGYGIINAHSASSVCQRCFCG